MDQIIHFIILNEKYMTRKQFFFWVKLRRKNIKRMKKGRRPIRFTFKLIEAIQDKHRRK